MNRRNSEANETDSICSGSEKVNKLSSTMGKLRTIGVKRPKCRTKFIVMASAVSVFLLIAGTFLFFVEFSSENEEKTYSGES